MLVATNEYLLRFLFYPQAVEKGKETQLYT